MQKKPVDFTILAIAIVILIAVLASSCSREPLHLNYYNAYSPLFNEYFVVASDRELNANDVVWFDDNSQVTDYATPYVARIISPYKK